VPSRRNQPHIAGTPIHLRHGVHMRSLSNFPAVTSAAEATTRNLPRLFVIVLHADDAETRSARNWWRRDLKKTGLWAARRLLSLTKISNTFFPKLRFCRWLFPRILQNSLMTFWPIVTCEMDVAGRSENTRSPNSALSNFQSNRKQHHQHSTSAFHYCELRCQWDFFHIIVRIKITLCKTYVSLSQVNGTRHK
jgi:hypothetical protein